jgi:hypothetical protein
MFNVGDVVILTPQAKEKLSWWAWKCHDHVVDGLTRRDGEYYITSLVDGHNAILPSRYFQLISPRKVYDYEELL